MPYIKQEDRIKFTAILRELYNLIQTEGELNYVITKILVDLIVKWEASYSTFNKIMGVLNCVTYEFYRIFVSRYEDKKILENGSVSNFLNTPDDITYEVQKIVKKEKELYGNDVINLEEE